MARVASANSISLDEYDNADEYLKAEMTALYLLQGQVDAVAQFLARSKSGAPSAEIPGDHD